MVGRALSMVAYGKPELMDPEEAMMMGVMQMMEPLKKQLEESYPTLDASNLPKILEIFKNYMNDQGGSPLPAAVMEGLL
jgi:hypothetical protein